MHKSIRKISLNGLGHDGSYPLSMRPTSFFKVPAPGTLIESRDLDAHTRVCENVQVDFDEPYLGQF